MEEGLRPRNCPPLSNCRKESANKSIAQPDGGRVRSIKREARRATNIRAYLIFEYSCERTCPGACRHVLYGSVLLIGELAASSRNSGEYFCCFAAMNSSPSRNGP
jgi:hypothetical protein